MYNKAKEIGIIVSVYDEPIVANIRVCECLSTAYFCNDIFDGE